MVMEVLVVMVVVFARAGRGRGAGAIECHRLVVVAFELYLCRRLCHSCVDSLCNRLLLVGSEDMLIRNRNTIRDKTIRLSSDKIT